MSFEVTNNRYLNFKLTNNFNPKISYEDRDGIGIKNTERRLKLLFANDFVLESSVKDNLYNLFLKTNRTAEVIN